MAAPVRRGYIAHRAQVPFQRYQNRTRLTANLAVETEQPDLSAAAAFTPSGAIDAAEGAAQSKLLLVDSVIFGHLAFALISSSLNQR